MFSDVGGLLMQKPTNLKPVEKTKPTVAAPTIKADPPSAPLRGETVGPIGITCSRAVTGEEIRDAVARWAGMDVANLIDRTQMTNKIVYRRRLGMFLANELTA